MDPEILGERSKIIIMVSHGICLEELGAYLGGRNDFRMEYCSIGGFIRKRVDQKWRQNFTGRSHFESFLK